MPISFPCPNPACTQVFSPQDVRGVTSLTCPKCGNVFQFGGAPAAVPARSVGPAKRTAPHPSPVKAAPPAAVPVAPRLKPVAAPRAAAIPLAQPVANESKAEVFIPPRPEPRTPRRGARTAAAGRTRGTPSRKRWIAFAILAVVFVSLGVTGWLLRDRLFGSSTTVSGDVPDIVSPPMNYRFQPPPRPWIEDKGVERELGASFALRRSDPNSWLALVVRDYKDRMPRDDELLHEAVSRLRKLFKKSPPEWELRDAASFAGLPAQRFVFTAENSNSVGVSGECLMAAYNGIGYCFFGWTPSAADETVLGQVLTEWHQVRQGFTLLKERDGWTGKLPEIVEAEGKGASYRLSYTKGLWENDTSTAGADLLLLGSDPDHPQDALKRAWIRVFVLPAKGDLETALKEARTFVEQREKKLYPELKMDAVPEAAKGGLADGEADLGKARAKIVRLRVEGGEEFERFFAIAAVPRPAYTLVIVGECAWQQREAWEGRFGPVMHSLRFDKR